MRTQSNVRITIFSSWLLFWIISSAALLIAPHFRKATIGSEQILPAIGSIASVWLPIMSCFAGFWFNQSERKSAAVVSLSEEQVYGAFGLSFAYLLFVFSLILWSAYGVDYGSPEYQSLGELAKGTSFQGQLDASVKISLWISPLATAPVLALTGRRSR